MLLNCGAKLHRKSELAGRIQGNSIPTPLSNLYFVFRELKRPERLKGKHLEVRPSHEELMGKTQHWRHTQPAAEAPWELCFGPTSLEIMAPDLLFG